MHHSCTYHNLRTWNAVPRFHFHFTRGFRSVWHTMEVSEFEFELGFRKITEKKWNAGESPVGLQSFCVMIGLKAAKFDDRIMLTWRSFKDHVFSEVNTWSHLKVSDHQSLKKMITRRKRSSAIGSYDFIPSYFQTKIV